MRKIQTVQKGWAETLSFDYQPSVMSQVGMDAFPGQVLAPCSETAALFLPPTKLVEVPTQFWNRGLNEKFSGDQRRQNVSSEHFWLAQIPHLFVDCGWKQLTGDPQRTLLLRDRHKNTDGWRLGKREMQNMWEVVDGSNTNCSRGPEGQLWSRWGGGKLRDQGLLLYMSYLLLHDWGCTCVFWQSKTS